MSEAIEKALVVMSSEPQEVSPDVPAFPRLTSEDRVYKPYPLKSVVILGMGNSTDAWLNYNYETPMPRQEGMEVWTINSGCLVFDHDVVFNMHDLEELKKIEPEKDFIGVYEKHNRPVVTIRPWDGAPEHIKEFPLGEVFRHLGQEYFANGISYMVAFALLCGIKEIYLFGCDYNYADSNMYERGRCNLEFWLGFASAYGVRISTSVGSTLLDMRYRTGDKPKGAQGFGKVYGYFDRQPQYDLLPENDKYVLTLQGFEDPPASFDSVDEILK